MEKLAEREDVAPGLLGYRDDRVVGWVSLGPREDYRRLASSKILAPVDDTPVWSIVCFVVSRRARGQGVAIELLAAAIDYARDHGATMLEAYPVDTTDGRVPAANAYHGTAPDVRTSRVPGRRTPPVEREDARPPHRPARLGSWLIRPLATRTLPNGLPTTVSQGPGDQPSVGSCQIVSGRLSGSESDSNPCLAVSGRVCGRELRIVPVTLPHVTPRPLYVIRRGLGIVVRPG